MEIITIKDKVPVDSQLHDKTLEIVGDKMKKFTDVITLDELKELLMKIPGY